MSTIMATARATELGNSRFRLGALLRPNTTADHDPAEEDDYGNDSRGHEQKDQLFSIQLNLMKAVVCH